jgi:hypothetical protein
MQEKNDEKWIMYAAQISTVLSELFDEDSVHYIGDLEKIDLTQFFHALASAAPARIFNKLTGSNKNLLEFNHIANQLVFQYSNKE